MVFFLSLETAENSAWCVYSYRAIHLANLSSSPTTHNTQPFRVWGNHVVVIVQRKKPNIVSMCRCNS
jgi:hypothetical protein